MKLNELFPLNESSLAAQIPNGADRRRYIALMADAEQWFAKSRRLKDMKKSHAIDMAKQAREEANEILHKYNIIEAHGNSKIYDKCWDGYRRVPGKKRNEPGSCVAEDQMTRTDIGFGLSQWANDNFALVGGYRDGSSSAGESRLRYDILSVPFYNEKGPDHAKIGYVVFRVSDEDDSILGLIDIKLDPKHRKSGFGRQLIKDIVDSTKDGLDIHDIKKSAQKFWAKVGTEFTNNRNTQGRISKSVSVDEAADTAEGDSVVIEDADEIIIPFGTIEEAEYQGKQVELNKPKRGGSKKFYVYTKNDKGNVVKVEFGSPDMSIKKSDPARKKSFRARHNCDNPGPKHSARYWSCRSWSDNQDWV